MQISKIYVSRVLHIENLAVSQKWQKSGRKLHFEQTSFLWYGFHKIVLDL